MIADSRTGGDKGPTILVAVRLRTAILASGQRRTRIGWRLAFAINSLWGILAALELHIFCLSDGQLARELP